MAYFAKTATLKKLSTKLAATGLLLTAVACTAGPEANTTPAEAENVTREEIVEGAENFIGQTVSIRGEVQEAAGDVSFLIDDEQLFGGKEILVVNVSGQPFLISDIGETQVQVTGEVQQFNLAEVEAAYDLTLEPNMYTVYEEQPVIIAQSIALAPDPGDITAEPEKYYNQVIAVEGEIESVVAPDVFTLDEDQLFGGEDLLVIGTKDAADIKAEDVVTVTGVLRPYIEAEFERDYGLVWELSIKEAIGGEYTEKPVFVAEEIYPSAVE